jgi:(p)ppGpp synthase/HD superfamily hydrolase
MTERFDRAFLHASKVHGDQVRKGPDAIPYISHLLAVASLVLDYGGSEDQAIAALLHDAPEDRGGRAQLEEIRAKFGETVARIVDGCTDTYETPKPDWETRKQAYVARLPGEHPDVHLVSAADKLHNARCILQDYRLHGDSLWERFNARRDRILWYYRTLVGIFRAGGTNPLFDELDRVVTALEEEVAAAAPPRIGGS